MHATHYIPRLFCQRIWNKSGLALFAGSIVLATVTEAEESNMEIQREKVVSRLIRRQAYRGDQNNFQVEFPHPPLVLGHPAGVGALQDDKGPRQQKP